MRARDLVGRKVMDVSSATSVGSIVGTILDPGEHRVSGFRINGSQPVLPLDDVRAIGADAVTVDGPSAVRGPTSDAEQRATNGPLEPLGSRVLDEDGVELGTVEDLEFDPDTGAITEIRVAGEAHAGQLLLGLGDYALVIGRPESG